jgi:hypothetical protein
MSQQLNQRAAHELHACRTGTLPQGPLAFGTALRQIALDDSPESLDRITTLLDQLRLKLRPVFEEFARDEACLNFAQLLAFYLGAQIARAAGTTMDWRDHHEALPLLPPGSPRKFATLVVGVTGANTGQTLCTPLRTIRDRLFGAQPTLGCREYVEQTVRQLRAQMPQPRPAPPPPKAIAPLADQEPVELIPVRRADAVAPAMPARGVLGKLGTLRNGRNAYWFETVARAGFLAASGMTQVEDGGGFAPTLLKPVGGRMKRSMNLVRLSGETMEAAIGNGQEALLENPEENDFLALLHEGQVRLPGGPTPALILECRSYRGEELHLQLALPYRKARQPGGFAIFCPRLMSCSAPPKLRPELFGAFYAGLDSFSSPGKYRNRHFDESL